MNRVFVLDRNKKPLMPCLPVRARELLNKKRAAVYRISPFTIIMKDRLAEDSDFQALELKIDPGSGTSGFAINAYFKRGITLIFGMNLTHRAFEIVEKLKKRAMFRRSRRGRKCRYRKARFNNRSIPKKWIAPSLRSILNNIKVWIQKIIERTSIGGISIEINSFDTQKMNNPNIAGVQYQRGTLFGYTVRNYLLAKYNHKCIYCEARNVSLTIDHIVPRINGGTNTISNLVIACIPCNQAKGKLDLATFLKNDPAKLKSIQSKMKKSLKASAYINILRKKLAELVESFGKPFKLAYGDETKFNRINQAYNKDHFIDAACIGNTGKKVFIKSKFNLLEIKAMGRGCRKRVGTDEFGFPNRTPKAEGKLQGFETGDQVVFTHTATKKVFRVQPRAEGNFNITDLALRIILGFPNKNFSASELDKLVIKFKALKKANQPFPKPLPTSVRPSLLKLVRFNDGYKYNFKNVLVH